MPLYKGWEVGKRKRKSIIADSFDEFVVNGELNSVSLLLKIHSEN